MDEKDPIGVDALKKFIKECADYIRKMINKNKLEHPSELPPEEKLKVANKIVELFEFYTTRPKISILFNRNQKYWEAFNELFSKEEKIMDKLTELK